MKWDGVVVAGCVGSADSATNHCVISQCSCFILLGKFVFRLQSMTMLRRRTSAGALCPYTAIKSQNTVKPNPICRLPVTSATSRDVPFSPNSITPTSPKLPVQGSFGEVGFLWQYTPLGDNQQVPMDSLCPPHPTSKLWLRYYYS